MSGTLVMKIDNFVNPLVTKEYVGFVITISNVDGDMMMSSSLNGNNLLVGLNIYNPMNIF